jgi:hypothetical protein
MEETTENIFDPKSAATSEEINLAKKIVTKSELSYYQKLKKKHKGYLLEGLDKIEKERIAQYIIDQYNNNGKKHKELCDRLTEYDEVYRMQRKEIIGSDGDLPNYRTPLSTTALDVVHANILNVFFSPKDPIRAIPTEPNDAPKASKLSTFANWSMKNELDLFTNIDRLFHSSNKNGESPFMIHWVKEYGVEIKREIVMNPDDPKEPLYDDDTGEVVYREEEEPTLLYNAPKMEILSRKDYIQPDNCMMNELPEWEMVIKRYAYDDVWKMAMSGKMYDDAIDEVKNWGMSEQLLNAKPDFQGDEEKTGDWKKEALLFFGKLRVNVIKDSKSSRLEMDNITELEDEFIAEVHIQSRTLLSLRKNKFPLKMRPVGMDYCIPDDEGRRAGIGMIEFLSSLQKAYDVLFNQYIFGTMQSNNPFGFFTPQGNMRNDPIKIKNGYLYPTSDPQSVNIIKIPPPDASLNIAIQLVTQWAQLLFGISDYAAGIESTIDPDSPARKAQIVVEQGNVRLNMIIKRKIDTIKDICFRWYLLYRDNMPKDKFMRIVGDSENSPWKFETMRIEDLQLKSLPDFELTGNILSANKQLQINTSLSIYQVMIQNPFFSPQSLKGIQALHSLTKWLIDKLDDTGLSRFLPKMPGDNVNTPEEENARFLQGDTGNPVEQEDHLDHIKKHGIFLQDSLTPQEIKPALAQHIAKHVEMLRQLMTQQAIMQQSQPPMMPQNGLQIPLNGQGGPQPQAGLNIQPQPQGVTNGQPKPQGQQVPGQNPPGMPTGVIPRQIRAGGGLGSRVPGMS